MQILPIMGNQFGQAVGSRWRGAHLPGGLPSSLLNGKSGGWGIRPSLPCQNTVLWAVVHGWVPTLHRLCSTPSRPQLPPHCSCSSAPHTSVLFPLASLGSSHSILHPQHPLSCLFPSSSAAAEFTCLHCCPSFRSLVNPPPACFLPLGFQSGSLLHDFSRRSSKETNSLWLFTPQPNTTPVSCWRTPARKSWLSPNSPRRQKMRSARGIF